MFVFVMLFQCSHTNECDAVSPHDTLFLIIMSVFVFAGKAHYYLDQKYEQ